jgi:hypothetical protein
MEPWAQEWLKNQRNEGVKCLEIKQRGTKHYVYYSTTHWDKSQNKAIKTSKYKGRLDPVRGLIEAHEDDQKVKAIRPTEVKSVTEYGNALLLQKAMNDLKPLLIEGFPDNWMEIYSLAMLRVNGNIPLKSGHFRFHKRLIRCGSRKCGDKYLYLFEDQDLLHEERNTIYDKLDRGELDKNQFDKSLKNAGRILILSNRKMSEQEAYEFYKKRNTVEKLFDTYKSTLYR